MSITGKTYSLVWNYFQPDIENPIFAKCLLCGVLMSRGGSSLLRCGTTNLRRHLSHFHGIFLPSQSHGGEIKLDF